jgi:hypothetical protein
VDKEPMTSLGRKRKWIPDLGLSSQNAVLEDVQVVVGLQDELKRMRRVEQDLKDKLIEKARREEELTTELKNVQEKNEEKIDRLMKIIECLTQQLK